MGAVRWIALLAIALRDLRGGLHGFAVFLGSIALGVAAITGVGSISRSLSDGLAAEGRAILGGDLSFQLVHREASPVEREFLLSQGTLSEVALLRAMARRPDGEAALVAIKAVDQNYPLAGKVGLTPDRPLTETLTESDGAFGLAADPALLAKLGLALGDELEIGAARFRLRAVLENEPDQLAGGVQFGARVLVSIKALRAAELLGPGSLVHWRYRLILDTPQGTPASDEALKAVVNRAEESSPEAGWEIRTRKTVSPQFSRNLDRFTQFLTLVGLTSLIVGGVGVANATRGYVERKKPTIAILKSVGATGTTVFALMLIHVMAVAAIGVGIGAAIGAALPYAVAFFFGSLIPFPLVPALYPAEIGEGLLYGFLTALAFSIWPLGRAHDVPVQALFRDEIEPRWTWPRRRYLALVAAAGFAFIGTAFLFASDRRLALIYAASTVAAFALLRGFAILIMQATARLPRPRNVTLRLALGNIHRPGALTPSVVLSLGLGIALIVALTLIDGNIRNSLEQGVRGETPSFFFVDVRSDETDAFVRFLKSRAPEGEIALVPMLRGRIVALNGRSVGTAKPAPQVAWVLEGDRGITFSATLPEGSSLVEGNWWPEHYDGEPLVSIESEVAEGLGLEIGDEVSVNVLGRNITAKIANTRKVNWRTLGINFVLVFSPNTFAGAPYGSLATLTFPGGGEDAKELALLREAARAFPAVTSIRVKDALEAVEKALEELTLAMRSASAVTLLSSILVLGGALAAGQQARIHDAVILKTLGATRTRLIAAYICEFGMIGVTTAIFGIAAGTAAALAIVRHVMDFEFVWLWGPAILAVAGALGVTICLGLAGTWHILGRKPAPYLREL